MTAVLATLRAYTLQNGNPPAINAGTTWYAIGSILLILALWHIDEDASLDAQGDGASCLARMRSQPMSWTVMAGGFGLNILALIGLYRSDFYSIPAGLLWLLSVAILLAMAFRIRLSCSDPRESTRACFGWQPYRHSELFLLSFLVLLSLGLRLWRLTDMGPGVFGDEGVVGIDAIGIVHGNLPSPFRGGWASQSLVYPYTIALFIKVFGANLAGLRAFAVVCGVATILLTYLLARELFGPRVALLAGFLMSFQSLALLYSRQQVSNDTLPFFIAGSTYLFVRGQRTGRLRDYALCGALGGSAVYYYAGGRSVGLLVLTIGIYFTLRHRAHLRIHGLHVATMLSCAWAVAGPFLVYSYIYTSKASSVYPNNRFIWLHHSELSQSAGSSNWLTILWDQIAGTISVLAYSIDTSAQYNLNYPISQPLEAMLLIPGLALALWRWRDARFAILNLIFWVSIIVGGVLTLGVPNVPRIVGILPVLPIVIAVVLDGLASCVARALALYWCGDSRWPKRAAIAVSMSGIAMCGAQNWHAYAFNYLNTHQFQVTTLIAEYAHQRGTGYYFYNFGGYKGLAPSQFWAGGVNGFINYDEQGTDVQDVARDLPVVTNGLNGDTPAIFLVWTPSPYYSRVRRALRAYYPVQHVDLVTENLDRGQRPLLVAVTVNRSEIEHDRAVHVCYSSASHAPHCRSETQFGLIPGIHLPAGATYPVAVDWRGAVVVPLDGTYLFRLNPSAPSTLQLDGKRILTGSTSIGPIAVYLSHGPHAIRLHADLARPSDSVSLQWKLPGGSFSSVSRRYLWDGPLPFQTQLGPG